MSEEKDNVLDFSTTVNEPEKAESKPKEVNQVDQQKNAETVVRKIYENRKSSFEAIQKNTEGLQEDLRLARQLLAEQPLQNFTNDKGDQVLSLENVLRQISAAVSNVLTNLESTNSLLDMVIHDFKTIHVHQQQLAQGSSQTNAHFHTLVGLLIEKGMVTEQELQEAFQKILKQAQQNVDNEKT